MRTLILPALAAAALVSPGVASAAFDAKLVVGTSTPGLPALRITTSFDRGPAPVGRVQVFIPAGYALKAPTAQGAAVGTADAIVFVTDVNGEEHMKGNVAVANPNDPLFAKVAPTCDNVPHPSAWVVNVTGAGADWNIPIFVDATTGSEQQLGPTKLVICLQPPDVPANNANRAPNGQRLISLTLKLTALTNPTAAGDVRWRALATPFTPATGALNPAGNLEAQSLLSLPQRLTLGVKKRGGKATLAGRVTANAKPLTSTLVQLEVSKTKKRLSPFARIRTNGSGAFSTSFRLTGTRYFRALVTTGDRDLGKAACTPSFGSAVPCVHAFSGGSQLLTGLVRVSRLASAPEAGDRPRQARHRAGSARSRRPSRGSATRRGRPSRSRARPPGAGS
jgi:hypothetical protein